MKELAKVSSKEGTNQSQVEYNFETNVLHNETYKTPMSVEEYNKVKTQTIKMSKEKGWNLSFEMIA